MTSLGGKLTALACYPTKRINKAEELFYISTNIAINLIYWKQLVPNMVEIEKSAQKTD
jgi:hypothetical protein